MADINEILGRNISSVKELKNAIKELQDSLVGVDTESEQFKTTSEQLAAAQAELNKVTKAGKADNDAATDSIRGMEQAYKALYDQYKMLTEEQRNSDFGKNMAASLEEMSTKVNEAKKEVGNFQNNIGRYAQGVTDAFNNMGVSVGGLQAPLKAATSGSKTFGAALKSLAANPIVLVITALVAILAKAADSIKKNEELTNRLKEAMSVFKPVLDAVSNAFDFLAGILVKTIEGLSKVAEKIMSVIPGMKSAIDSHKELAKATNDLTKAQREANVENSKKQAEIERLREEASATDDVIEKKKLLEEAKAIQAEVDQKNIELAQEELRILQEYSEKTANAAEDNEKLAAAQQKVNDAIAQGERNMRQYNKQINTVTNTTKSARGAAKNYREEAKKLYESLVEDNKTEIQKLTEKYEKEKRLLEKYHLDTKLLTNKYNKEMREIQLTAWRKTIAEHNTLLDNQYDNMARAYNNMRDLAAGSATRLANVNLKQTTDAASALNKFIQEAYSYIGDVDSTFKRMFEAILNNIDLSQVADKLSIRSMLEGVLDKKDKKAVMALFDSFTEEGWAELVQSLQNKVNELNKRFNLDIKTLPDARARAHKLGYDLATAIGESFQAEVNDRFSSDKLNIYEKMFEELSDTYSTGGIIPLERTKEELAEWEYMVLNSQKQAYERYLYNFSGNTEQRLAILEQYYGVVEQLEERWQALIELDDERWGNMLDDTADAFSKMSSALNTYKSSQEALIDSEVKSGKMEEKEAQKKKDRLQKLEEWQAKFSIASIIADAAAGAFSIWKGYATEVGTVNPQTAAAAGPGAAAALAALNAKSLTSAIAKSVGLAATAAAQISAVRGGLKTSQNNYMSDTGEGGGTIGVGATPTLIDSTPYSYTRTVQTTEEEDEMNRPIYVTVTDIEDGLKQKVTVTDESSF